jgi:NADH-quinone oxidoreductase subunit E
LPKSSEFPPPTSLRLSGSTPSITTNPEALRGADRFLQELCERLGIEEGGTTPDGLFTVEAVKCLAACHRAPVFQVQGDGEIVYHENQTVELAMAWIEEVRNRVAAKEGRP